MTRLNAKDEIEADISETISDIPLYAEDMMTCISIDGFENLISDFLRIKIIRETMQGINALSPLAKAAPATPISKKRMRM